MAIRGDDALKIQQRAGHTTFDMTQKYIRTAEAVGEVIGAVFPALPLTLLSPLNGLANCPNDPQAVDIIVEAPGIEPGLARLSDRGQATRTKARGSTPPSSRPKCLDTSQHHWKQTAAECTKEAKGALAQVRARIWG